MNHEGINKPCDGNRAKEETFGLWLAEYAETKEADELLFSILKDTKPAATDAGSAFKRISKQLGITHRASCLQRIGRWSIRIAACLFVPVSAMSFYFYGEAQRPGEWLEAYAPYGDTREVILPDGSKVVLNSGSKLIYPDKFGPDRRQVFLSGECYATIGKDPRRQFIMSAGEVDIRVFGTQFNLKSYAEDSEIEVALIYGSLAMESKSGKDTDSSIMLKPGELVQLDKQTGATETFDINVDMYKPVVSGGGLFFMDKRFDEIVAYLEKRFNVIINISDKSLTCKRFIASFVNGETLDEMLASFNADGEMRIRREERVINITKL
jgi:ferric-dicitrate binding protein FerR (iron transport regulator)